MTDIAFATSDYERATGDLPSFRLVNMFIEESATAPKQIVAQSREGLVSSAVRGSGPINGMFSQEGTFGGAVFTVSGSSLYRDGTLLGAIAGTGPVSWAASAIEVVVTRGGAAYSYNGSNLAAIATPDSFAVTAVTFIAGLFVFARAGSHKFYWSSVLDARTIDALDFASAENAPDELRDIVRVGDSLLLCGSASIETWIPTGELNLPFSRVVQRLYGKGVIATDCAVEVDNSLLFIGNDGMVYRLGDVPQRISDHGLEERIRASASFSAFFYIYEGHTFFVCRLSQGTWVYDIATGKWPEFATYGQDNWRARCATMVGDAPLLGDDTAGNLFTFGAWSDAAVPVIRIFTAGFVTAQPVIVDNLEVEANIGGTDAETGQASNPILEMRVSRDGGKTFGAWRTTTLGRQGERRRRARYRALGMADSPGAIYEFRLSDPSPLRVSAVRINEAGGGRSR